MFRLSSAVLMLTLFALVGGAQPRGDDSDEWVDSSPHESRYIDVGGFELNYLDWGGGGGNLIFVPGLGDSPHLFDQLAPEFTDRYRVLSYARRGHGSSSTPPDAEYDIDTLTEDLRALMDRLEIESASLVGFSMGGLEINRFAVLYPDRVEKLVYLDGAYDYSDPGFTERQDRVPVDSPLTEADRATTGTLYRWFLTKGWRIGLPESDALWASVVDASEPSPTGGVQLVVNDEFTATLFDSVMNYRQEYTQIGHPSLAIYGLWHAPHSVPEGAGPDVLKAVEEWLREYSDPWQRQSIARFREEAPNGRVVELPETHHVVFLHRPDEVLRQMNEFLNQAGNVE